MIKYLLIVSAIIIVGIVVFMIWSGVIWGFPGGGNNVYAQWDDDGIGYRKTISYTDITVVNNWSVMHDIKDGHWFSDVGINGFKIVRYIEVDNKNGTIQRGIFIDTRK